jgi:hypothetical protein
MEGLTPGRIVHFVADWESAQGQHRPAIIVSLPDPSGTDANLQVFKDLNLDPNPMPTFWVERVSYSETAEPGTWHWIERS